MRFPIRIGRLKPLLVATGMTPSRCYLELHPELVRVRMSWGFQADIPRASIQEVRRVANAPHSIGVHGWRGHWIVNGASGPLVQLTLAPKVPARAVGMPIALSRLAVSVDDPDGLVGELAP